MSARVHRRVALASALIAGAALLGGCSTARQVVLPIATKQPAYVIDCSGANLSWSHCYQKAGKACPHGYAIKEQPYKHGERVVAGDALQVFGVGGDHRRMLIECSAPAGDAAVDLPTNG